MDLPKALLQKPLQELQRESSFSSEKKPPIYEMDWKEILTWILIINKSYGRATLLRWAYLGTIGLIQLVVRIPPKSLGSIQQTWIHQTSGFGGNHNNNTTGKLVSLKTEYLPFIDDPEKKLHLFDTIWWKVP